MSFYKSKEWLSLRYKVISHYGRVCMCCQSCTGPFHVDHIKPISKYPELKLEITNLQVLCEACNLGKSNKYEHDFREKPLVIQTLPPGYNCFIKFSKKGVFHKWNGRDTACRMYSTGGLTRKNKFELSQEAMYPTCSLCESKNGK